MGGSFEVPSSSFSCEMRIIEAKNMDPTSSGGCFVRLILSAGKDRHVCLETREVPLLNSALDWNESFSLQCSGSGDSIKWLKRQSVTLELRHRNKASGLGRFLGTRSKLLGRVEAPWKEVFESPNLGVETWTKMFAGDGLLYGCDDGPWLRIAMNLIVNRDSKGTTVMKKGRDKARNCYDCCCNECNNYSGTLDYDVFTLVAALEGL